MNVRGCPGTISLTPATATSELGTADTTHTADATVADDFGDPVDNVDVDFTVVSGPNAGKTGSATTARCRLPQPDDTLTDSASGASFGPFPSGTKI